MRRCSAAPLISLAGYQPPTTVCTMLISDVNKSEGMQSISLVHKICCQSGGYQMITTLIGEPNQGQLSFPSLWSR